MPYRQIGAVTRRKIRPDFVGINQAQAPMLFRQKQIEDSMAHRDRMYDLERTNLARNTAMAREALEHQKDVAATRKKLGIANIGAGALGGAAKIYADYDLGTAKDSLDAAKNIAPALQGALPDLSAPDYTDAAVAAGSSGAGRAAEGLGKVAGGAGGFLSDIAKSDTVDAIRKPISGAVDYAGKGLSSIYHSTLGPVIEWALK